LEKIDPDEVDAFLENNGPKYLGSAVIDVLETNTRSFMLDYKEDLSFYMEEINRCLLAVQVEQIGNEFRYSDDESTIECTLRWGDKVNELTVYYLEIIKFVEAINELINVSGYEFVPYDTCSDDYGFIVIQSSRVKEFISKEIMDGFFNTLYCYLEDE
jgi:hypothetical protein